MQYIWSGFTFFQLLPDFPQPQQFSFILFYLSLLVKQTRKLEVKINKIAKSQKVTQNITNKN